MVSCPVEDKGGTGGVEASTGELSQAEVCESVLMDNVQVGPGARIHRAIIDEGARIPAGYRIGGDAIGDEGEYPVFFGGIAVVPRGAKLATGKGSIPTYAYSGSGRLSCLEAMRLAGQISE